MIMTEQVASIFSLSLSHSPSALLASTGGWTLHSLRISFHEKVQGTRSAIQSFALTHLSFGHNGDNKPIASWMEASESTEPITSRSD